jgi:hypothetical protein
MVDTATGFVAAVRVIVVSTATKFLTRTPVILNTSCIISERKGKMCCTRPGDRYLDHEGQAVNKCTSCAFKSVLGIRPYS